MSFTGTAPIRTARRPLGLAALWGFAEASFFFVVPDVLLGWLALKRPRIALLACGFAAGGALLGGSLVWVLTLQDGEWLIAVMDRIPAINEQMIADVGVQIQEHGLAALFIGPMIGVPYKLYALQAALADHAFWQFLVISFPARALRFVAVTLLVWGLSYSLRNHCSEQQRKAAYVAVWLLFYIAYFIANPG